MLTTKRDDDAQQRLQKILQGAFAGPPTPLKNIPTRSGESRSIGKKKPQRRRWPANARTGGLKLESRLSEVVDR